ncbi:MAG: hypothetical protein IKD62_07455, partial [Oscillospiraceae bacterium]|nr:hypothetical protein [Oscillospiraceae bacterium]
HGCQANERDSETMSGILQDMGYTPAEDPAEADLILINTDDDVSLVNHEYRIGNVLYAGDGHAVDTVFCNGKLMVRNKKIMVVDEEEIIHKCREVLSGMNARIAGLEAEGKL